MVVHSPYISLKQPQVFFASSETGQVRLWAAMRTQTVAKTVVGALQCALEGQALGKSGQRWDFCFLVLKGHGKSLRNYQISQKEVVLKTMFDNH